MGYFNPIRLGLLPERGGTDDLSRRDGRRGA